MSVIDNRGNEITHALRRLRGEEPSGRMFSWGGPGTVPAVLPPEHDFELHGDGACRHCGYTLIELEDGLISKICALKPPVGDVVFHGPDRRGRCYWRLADGLRFTGTREDYRRFVVERNAKASQPALPKKPLTEPAPKTLLDIIRHATQAGRDLFGRQQLDNLQQTTGYMTTLAQARVRSAPDAQHQQHLAAHLAALAALREKNAAAVFNSTIAHPTDLGQMLIGEMNAQAASPPSMLAVFADAMRTLDDSARLWSNPGFLALDKALPDSETTVMWAGHSYPDGFHAQYAKAFAPNNEIKKIAGAKAVPGTEFFTNNTDMTVHLRTIENGVVTLAPGQTYDSGYRIDRNTMGVCANCTERVPLSTMHKARDGCICSRCDDGPF